MYIRRRIRQSTRILWEATWENSSRTLLVETPFGETCSSNYRSSSRAFDGGWRNIASKFIHWFFQLARYDCGRTHAELIIWVHQTSIWKWFAGLHGIRIANQLYHPTGRDHWSTCTVRCFLGGEWIGRYGAGNAEPEWPRPIASQYNQISPSAHASTSSTGSQRQKNSVAAETTPNSSFASAVETFERVSFQSMLSPSSPSSQQNKSEADPLAMTDAALADATTSSPDDEQAIASAEIKSEYSFSDMNQEDHTEFAEILSSIPSDNESDDDCVLLTPFGVNIKPQQLNKDGMVKREKDDLSGDIPFKENVIKRGSIRLADCVTQLIIFISER